MNISCVDGNFSSCSVNTLMSNTNAIFWRNSVNRFFYLQFESAIEILQTVKRFVWNEVLTTMVMKTCLSWDSLESVGVSKHTVSVFKAYKYNVNRLCWKLLHVSSFLGLLLYPEDIGSMFLQSVGSISTTTWRYIPEDRHPTSKRYLFPFPTNIWGACMTACAISNLVHQPSSNHDKQKREGAEGKGRSLVVGIHLLCLHTTPSSPPPSLFYPCSSMRGRPFSP
jgi:hypothetical protein